VGLDPTRPQHAGAKDITRGDDVPLVQTEAEKAAIRAQATEKAKGVAPPTAGKAGGAPGKGGKGQEARDAKKKPHRLSRKKRRRMDAAADMEREEREAAKAGDDDDDDRPRKKVKAMVPEKVAVRQVRPDAFPG
jgi:hypothetical protein